MVAVTRGGDSHLHGPVSLQRVLWALPCSSGSRALSMRIPRAQGLELLGCVWEEGQGQFWGG